MIESEPDRGNNHR